MKLLLLLLLLRTLLHAHIQWAAFLGYHKCNGPSESLTVSTPTMMVPKLFLFPCPRDVRVRHYWAVAVILCCKASIWTTIISRSSFIPWNKLHISAYYLLSMSSLYLNANSSESMISLLAAYNVRTHLPRATTTAVSISDVLVTLVSLVLVPRCLVATVYTMIAFF